MSTIPLFQGDESVEDLCLLIKSLHEEMSTVHRKVDVLLAIKTDNTEALREMVASGPALAVVPNEDEAVPVVEEATSPRKKQRLPDSVRELGVRARDLHKQADAKAEKRAKVLEASKGRETKESVALLIEEQDFRTEAVRLLSEYDKARGIIRKNNKNK